MSAVQPTPLPSNRNAGMPCCTHSLFPDLLKGSNCAKALHNHKNGRKPRLSKWKLACGSGMVSPPCLQKHDCTWEGFFLPLKWIFMCVPDTFPSPAQCVSSGVCGNAVCHVGLFCGKKHSRFWAFAKWSWLTSAAPICFYLTRNVATLSKGIQTVQL